MTLEELTKDESNGAEWIEDEVRFVLSDAHGMENGTDFVFYMPDTPLDGLDSEFMSWWPDYYKLSGEAPAQTMPAETQSAETDNADVGEPAGKFAVIHSAVKSCLRRVKLR